MKWIAYRKVKKAGKYGKRNKAPTESGEGWDWWPCYA